MPKYRRTSGEEYNITQDQVEDFMSTYPDAVEITDEIQEPVTEGKISDVATVDVAVTSEPDTASESTELESVDTSGELQPGEQGYFRQERRKGRSAKDIRSGVIKPEYSKELTFEEDFATDVTSPSFNDLTPDQLQDIQDEAITQLISQYSEEENFKFDDTDVRLKAISIFENKVLPKVSLEKDTKLETFIKEKAPILNPYADFISDLYTAGKQGLATSELVDPTFELLKKGSDTSDEDIVNWIDVNKKVASKNMQSDEMRDFNRIYEENGSGIFGFIKGVASNPSVMPSLLVSSMATQLGSLRSEEVAGAAALGAGTGAGLGAAAGTLGGPLAPITSSAGAVTGAISGGIAAGAGAMEASLTFSELLQEEVGEDLSLEAVKELFNDEERVEDLQRKAINRGIAIGLVEGLTGGIAKGVTGKAIKAGLSKPVASAAGIAVESIGGGTGEVAGRVAAGQEMDIAEIGFEAITGTTTAPITVGSELLNLNNSIANYQINKELKNTEFNNIEQAFSPEATTTEAQIKISQNKKAQSVLDNRLKRDVVKGNITQEQADNTKKNFIETQGAVNKLKPLNLNEKVQADAVNLIKEKTNLQNEIKQVDEPSLTEAQVERIKEIDNSLRKISKEAKTAETAKVGQAISQLEKVGIQTLSTEEIQSYLQNNNLVENQEDAIKKSGEGAFIVQNPDTQEQEIIVNKDIGSISDPSHEALHALIFQTVRKSPDTARRLGESLQEQLNKVNPNLIEDSGIRERLELYNQDPTAVQMEEVLTLFSDTVRNGTVKFNDNTFTKIGDFIRQFLSSLGVKAKFNNGRDVYNFIKDYNKSIESGKLTKGQVRAAKEGVTGKLVGPKIETFDDAAIIKEARSDEASQRVQEIYDQQGEAGAFDIIEQFKPITSRIVERRSEAPGFDRQLLTDEIETGQRGIIDLIKEYKPESGVPLAAYINKFLPARAIEASKRVLGEEFTEDVTEARGVAAEEVVTETAVKPEAKAIDPFRIMPNVKETATAEVQKSIADKDVDVTEITYKELKDVAPYQTVADFFNIPVSRIKNPKDNLRKSDDIANIQRWILKNEPTLKNLFTEANRDVVEVTEGNRVIRQGGEPTAIPRNLLNKFYTKGDRVGNNFQWKLKPYDRTTFLEAVGIKDGKVDPNFTPRAAEAQTIKGILDMYTRNLGNVAARDIIEGREDIAPAERARVQAEVAKGKPRIMLSRSQENAFIYSPTSENDFAQDIKGYSDIVKEAGYTPIKMRTAEGRKKFLDDAVSSGLVAKLPKDFWLSLTGTSKSLPDGSRTYAGNFPFLNKSEAQAWIKEQEANGVVFPESSSNIKALYKKFNYKANKNNLALLLNNPNFIEEQSASLEGLKEIWLTIEKEMSNNPEVVIPLTAAAFSSTSAYQGTTMRVAAPVRFFEKGYKNESFVEEHTLPASILAKYLLAEGINGNIEKVWPNVERNYQQGALLKTSDKKLKGRSDVDEKRFDYTSVTPEGWNMTDNIWARYFNPNVAGNGFGIDPNNIITEAGLSIFDLYGVNASGNIVSNVFNLTQQKAAQINNNKVPKNFRVMASKSMPNVLDNMSNLDADAKQANKEFYNSVDLNKEFNDILEVKTGIASEKRYKRVKAEVVGANKGRFQFFIPPSAEDFTGLLYSTLAKGKLGDAQMAWYKKNLLDPYGKAMNELSSARIAMMNDYKALKKELKLVPKDLRKKVPGEPFTQEQAVRVYIWQKQGMSVPGISETDMQELSDFVEGKEDLKTFADQLIYIQKGDQYAGPKEGWPAGTITTDMLEGLNTTKRAKALEQWQTNVDEIFSEANLNKLEAAYGKPYRKAMENMLQRMKSGRNRNFQGDTLTGRVTDWLTGSIGTIMFFNTRSALLQTISSINFVNFTDNNILAAGKAFANQKQYWSDFMTLMNSDFLKERRGGLRINVNEADIADMAKKGGARGAINKLLEFGFTPTQIADSFAIASGGATFYRNRIKSLKKQGMTDAEAEAQAFVDFRETAEESQQSSRPDRISMQQAGPLGRVVLAFANTPAQYARLIKKAASDLKNGRGDAKTNISKIIYYGVAQNLLFNALQQALFAFAFDDDEEDTDEQQKKYISIANGMMDSLLRGIGLGGAVLSVGKNSIKRIVDEMEKKQPKLEKVGYELTKISPPASAKLSRINQAARSYQWDKKEMMEKGWSLDNPAYLAGANVIAALTNVPLDRAIKKTNNVVQATSQDIETWERLALLGGWQDWEIGIDEEKPANKPQPRKTKRKIYKR